LSATHAAGERLSPLPESTFKGGAIIGFKGYLGVLEELAARHDDDVEPCRDLVTSENLSYQPLSAISLNGSAQLLRCRNPQTARTLASGQDKHRAEAAMEPGVPESFNVLIRELQSLCLDVELIKAGEKKPVLSAAAD
jgi:DNA-directed RNA polymerase beta subunit